jgi:hypothetical protein
MTLGSGEGSTGARRGLGSSLAVDSAIRLAAGAGLPSRSMDGCSTGPLVEMDSVRVGFLASGSVGVARFVSGSVSVARFVSRSVDVACLVSGSVGVARFVSGSVGGGRSLPDCLSGVPPVLPFWAGAGGALGR